MNSVDISQIVSAGAAIASFVGSVIVYKMSLGRERRLDTLRTLSELRMRYPTVEGMCKGDKLDYLQELEFFATGVNNKIYDIKIVKRMSKSRLTTQYNLYLKKFIEERREKKNSTSYIEYEKMIQKLEN